MSDAAAKTAALTSTATLLAVLFNGKNAYAAGGGNEWPPEVLQALGVIIQDQQEILNLLKNQSMSGFRGWPENADIPRTIARACPAALTPYQVPEVLAPDGFTFMVKSHPGNAVGSLINVAGNSSDCVNPNSSWPLIPNETYVTGIKNSKEIWVSTNIPGSIALITIEQRR